jgi:hypothetical protein
MFLVVSISLWHLVGDLHIGRARGDTAISEAVKGLRVCGCSWAEIGSRLGVTRHAARSAEEPLTGAG